ncbi:PREDICTED: uncharacterized protein LOC107070099 [Polistes dominula]|uniref:Uncharacterized protein LOC107070099 n=1 Tax=Polistes dominula TaxID=743375 RepID=A0ABM1ITC6_POLDO|nr:PREDICTED: uncharacterized protein LOC107070099 [Polistes dominula]XP_015183464.1 PREDICTED: uncharacterized protein LOC107070099 [Polistes dominula]XP_015183465.1 PREDICTED: uncharacterized protein LOC107070099 [Polistes dominula]XP_015183467.1 PREDICTED: uncharacterized protein LOC107070099 [Polistes dominula]XP_015183468.1 PREDICTED: uncharacterized protein LOC107070099 [Polistes dominula]XP_015183469.1 PREDICTED: uncharacterized protein LOC107070099 [Polistes dominula]
MIKTKLEAYRRKKHREEMIESLKSSIKGILSWNENSNVNVRLSNDLSNEETEKLCQPVVEKTTKQKVISKEKIEDLESADDVDNLEDDTEDNAQCHLLSTIIYFLYFSLWIVLYIIAVQIEFGAVYFVISALVLICLNTRSRPRKKGEPSAYSVFNPNCEAIEGTLDASQFEREIRYGASSVH